MATQNLTLFADTDCDIRPEVAEEYGYRLISMPYTIDGKEVFPYETEKTFNPHAFYDRLRNGDIPKTAGLSPEKYISYFEPELQKGNDILYVHFSSKLSGTFNAMARQLQETLEEVENERNKLGTLFLHMTDGVVAFSRDGGVIHANPAAEEMLGRSIPVGGTVDYDALFRDVVPLDQVLDVADEGYLEGVLARDDRILELLLAPYDRER